MNNQVLASFKLFISKTCFLLFFKVKSFSKFAGFSLLPCPSRTKRESN